MKRNFLNRMLVFGALATSAAVAQETNELELLRRELRELRTRTQVLEQKLESLEKKPAAVATPAPQPVTASPEAQPATAEAKSWSPTDPIRLVRGRNYMDISFDGLFAAGGSTANDIEGGTQLGGHDPNQRGFTVQNVELTFTGAVDPYFRAQANVILQLDSGGESFLELEEAFAETTSLPWNLQAKAGQFFSEFGRLNTQHPHVWAFVDQPLVNGRFFGPDGLRNPGARLSWLVPTPFFAELSLGVQDSQGETAASFRSGGHGHGEETEDGLPFGFRHADNNRGVKGLGDMLFTPRFTASFDLTDSQTLLLGASGAFGPNSSGTDGDTCTQIYGVDVFWKWKPTNAHGGFPFVSWQTEAMLRRYQLGAFDWDENGNTAVDDGEVVDPATDLPALLTAETVTDWGLYTQWLYGFRKGWVAGLRLDYVAGHSADYERRGLTLAGEELGRDPLRARRWRVSPNLTWYPSEFSKLRLQYNYDDRDGFGVDHSVWFQFEFLLGAHAAHKF